MGLEKDLVNLRRNVPLKDFTTFKIGGEANYFYIVKSKEELIKVLKAAEKNGTPFFILGGGSNILFSDSGFKGLIIKMEMSELKISANAVYAEAGAMLPEIAKETAKKGYGDLSWMGGIPGTLGGAVFQNASAFGRSIADSLRTVAALDILNGMKIKNYTAKECNFSYKKSIFKENPNLIILSAILRLKKQPVHDAVSSLEKYINYRRAHHPLDFPSAGSVFENFLLNNEKNIKIAEEIFKKYPEIQDFSKKGFIPAGFFIEKCGLKGKRIGGAKISEKHANFIINYDHASARDVLKLTDSIKKEVRKKFRIDLKEEIIAVEG